MQSQRLPQSRSCVLQIFGVRIIGKSEENINTRQINLCSHMFCCALQHPWYLLLGNPNRHNSLQMEMCKTDSWLLQKQKKKQMHVIWQHDEACWIFPHSFLHNVILPFFLQIIPSERGTPYFSPGCFLPWNNMRHIITFLEVIRNGTRSCITYSYWVCTILPGSTGIGWLAYVISFIFYNNVLIFQMKKLRREMYFTSLNPN